MTQMIVDPDELVRFASYLDTESDALKQHKDVVSYEVASMRDVWRDAKYERFENIFNEAANKLERFIEDAHEYAQYLREQADIVNEYLDNTYPG
jgi:uncharacterized protein YukE